jgi:homoaconitase/3-isopropylmalate dehydratase large subunit
MCGMIAPDAKTCEYLSQVRGEAVPVPDLANDPGCEYERVYRFDLSDLVPQVACPPRPDRVVGIDQLCEVPITRAYIGSCTGGKLYDIQQAAEVLNGRRVAPGVSLFVVPASQAIRRQAEELGYMRVLREAGAQILKSGCGACINAGLGGLGREETGVYATNRNFQGRSGDPTAKNYLASPRVVAISAIRGKISDRLEVTTGGPEFLS